jgi:large subunit ribosomal protein L21
MYAIIATVGKQYKVAEGDIIKVEKLGLEAGATYILSFAAKIVKI